MKKVFPAAVFAALFLTLGSTPAHAPDSVFLHTLSRAAAAVLATLILYALAWRLTHPRDINATRAGVRNALYGASAVGLAMATAYCAGDIQDVPLVLTLSLMATVGAWVFIFHASGLIADGVGHSIRFLITRRSAAKE